MRHIVIYYDYYTYQYSRDDLKELPYLTMCIKESLRLTPTVPAAIREVTKPLTLNGIQLEPGTQLELNIWALHHNRNVWGEDHMVHFS